MTGQGEAKPLYAVIAVTQDQLYDGSGPAKPGYMVEFHVLGQEGHSLFIPMADFTPDTVKAKIEEAASSVAAVLSMAGPDIQMDVNGQPIPPLV